MNAEKKRERKEKYVPPDIKEVWDEGIGIDIFYYII